VYWILSAFALKRANGSPQGFALRDDGMAFVATLKGTSGVLDMESLPLKRVNGSPQGFALRDDGAIFARGPWPVARDP